MTMISKRMAFLFCKAGVVILVLCFTVVQLASIRKGSNNDPDHIDLGKHIPHDIEDNLHRPDSPISNTNKKSVIDKNAPVMNQHALLLDLERKDTEDNSKNGNRIMIDERNLKSKDLNLKQDEEGDKVDEMEKNGLDEKSEGGQPGQQADGPVDRLHDQVQVEVPKEKINIQKQRGVNEDEEERDDDEEEDDEFPAHQLKDVRKLDLSDLRPPDHMAGVKMELDGHLNRDYKKEIIIGNHEEFEKQSDMNPDDILQHVFDRVDKDRDHYISLTELQEWIVNKVQEHFDEANEEAERIFKHLDSKHTGHITWHEFHVHFLVAKGYDPDKAEKHATDYETIPLDPDEKERLIRYKFRWAEADEEPQDNKLNLAEFKTFRHPEQSVAMLDRMVQDIIDNLDSNTDGEVSVDEFIALPPGELDGAVVDSDRAWQEERRKEYQNVIDLNRDGKLTRDELKNYVDPQNPNHAKLEAENLIELADDNDDGRLSLNEVLDNSELFLGSKMVDTGRNFHDEF